MKRLIANILATCVALLGGAMAIYFSYRMREPQGALDWLSLLFAGVIVGLIGFFLTWGHFQADPIPGQPAAPAADATLPDPSAPPQRS